MPLANLETGGIARCLAQIADRPDDHIEAFFEVIAESRVTGAAGAMTPGERVEQGLAIRLLRNGESWLSSADGISPEIFARAVARVARARPSAVAPPPRTLTAVEAPRGDVAELEHFVAVVEKAVSAEHAAFPVEWDLREHRRWSRAVGSMLSPEPQEERFYACEARTSWGSWGTLLLALDESAAEGIARSLTRSFRAQRSPAPPEGLTRAVLGPAATAVFLHEAVAHALETDTLRLSGDPEAAIGLELAAPALEVLDDPAGAPEPIRRLVDDEVMPVVRRWLLRRGAIEQPLADLQIAGPSTRLVAGAARRGSRHLAPVPRSTHLELLPGEVELDELLRDCGVGLHVEEFSSGRLDPLSGKVELCFPYARRIEEGRVTGLTGPGRLGGSLVDLLQAVRGVGASASSEGAGWCAKGGHRLAVWATTPPLAIDGFEVSP